MIYTVTFNPSLDYIVDVPHFEVGDVNRTEFELLNPGGKGINVSLLLTNLGMENTALGFSAGFTGHEIVRMLDREGVKNSFITVANGFSRINVKIRSGNISEINGRGPEIGKDDICLLYSKLDELTSSDILVLAGSIPDGMPDSIYMDIMKHLESKHLRVVVDATQELLMNVLKYKPFLVKPNDHELAEMLGVNIETKDDVVKYAGILQKKGAANVLVSMGGDGAVLLSADGRAFKASSPKGKVLNTVGAGDSMVAGFLTGYLRTCDYKEALHLGLCAGSATAFSDGIASRDTVEEVFKTYDFIANVKEEENENC